MKQEERRQEDHYNSISIEYEKHYDDRWSNLYLKWCVFPHLFKNISIKGKIVVDAMCGTGQLTRYIQQKKPDKIIGIDISEKQLQCYKKKNPNVTTICTSVTQIPLERNSVDVICVSGGLHHVYPYFNETLMEFYRILKPNGIICFSEPHQHSIVDKLRQLWYKRDPLFEENEKSIDISSLKKDFQCQFKVVKEKYIGTLAHFFVLNSMVFRIPVCLKWLYSPLFIIIEFMLNFLPQKYIASNVICQLIKKEI